MSETSHRTFFGDAERSFTLTPAMIVELERVTGVGIGSMCKRFFGGEFRHVEVCETVRLALVGGGEPAERAAALVAAYVAPRPIAESYPLALSILEALWFGAKPAPLADETGGSDAAA